MAKTNGGASGSRWRMDQLWRDLAEQGEALASTRIDALFDADPNRFEHFHAAHDDMLLDFSKEKIDAAALETLLKLPEAAEMGKWRRAMFNGEIVNGTERRAARHNLLRTMQPPLAGVADMREQFLDFAQMVRTGARLGSTGKQFTDVVNIGIGGSYLGPRLAVEALKPFADGPRIHFVSNVDPWNFHNVVDELDPARTLFLCASKSFGTQETVLNLRAAISWTTARLGPEAIGKHFCAITARPDAARGYGIEPENIFQIWDWAGGRFSIWSAMGLCVAIRVGRDVFSEFLSGGANMDRHFESAPPRRNLPLLLALIGVWRRNVQNYPSYVLAPYEERLASFPEYVQQLEMESNGKSVQRDGRPVGRATAPTVIGGAGTNAQHSFFQKLHQGPDASPVDFLVGVETTTQTAHQQRVLLAHCLAQSQALMRGLSAADARETLAQNAGAGEAAAERAERLAPHVACPGDRPSTTLMYRKLDPRTLGRLVALYEHKIFAQAVIWNIECFDQWGVELGKRFANKLLPKLDDERSWKHEDGSTRGLLSWRRGLKDGG
ncbi:MAG: glucose-6-phosphate isomerase [Neomegalonema sp.]|nr:glucose-6-phosphate isomerase [Neomegalonema sp.]